jgi:hypothetical protein
MAGRRKNKRAAGSAGGAAAQRKALDDDDDGAGLVEQDLTEAELKDRGDELVSWLVKKEQIETKKSSAVEKFNAEIKLSKQRIHVLTREIDTRKAYVDPQQSLFEDSSAPPPPPGNDAQAAAS